MISGVIASIHAPYYNSVNLGIDPDTNDGITQNVDVFKLVGCGGSGSVERYDLWHYDPLLTLGDTNNSGIMKLIVKKKANHIHFIKTK
jgi:hypothetical protein